MFYIKYRLLLSFVIPSIKYIVVPILILVQQNGDQIWYILVIGSPIATEFSEKLGNLNVHKLYSLKGHLHKSGQ